MPDGARDDHASSNKRERAERKSGAPRYAEFSM